MIKNNVIIKSPWYLTIGDNCWLGEGSVATKDMAANGIYLGNPAVKIRERIIN